MRFTFVVGCITSMFFFQFYTRRYFTLFILTNNIEVKVTLIVCQLPLHAYAAETI